MTSSKTAYGPPILEISIMSFQAASAFIAADSLTSAHARSLYETAQTQIGQKGGVKALAEGKKDQFRVNPFALHVKDDFNARDFDLPENKAHVEELAQSIAVNGVRKAIEVYLDGSRLVVTDGECRLRATIHAIEVLGAEIKTVPVVMGERGENEADRVAQQIICNSGKRFNALEQGKVFKRLVGFGWSDEDIARKTGTPIQTVSRWLELQSAPEAILAFVRDGRVSATEAWRVLKSAASEDEAVETLTSAVEDAESTGRKKATARNVRKATGVATPKQMLGDVREAFATATIDEDEETETVTLTLDAATFAKIKAFILV